ncbi:MAG: outer membrane protein assembly factor BamA [Gemmatimonadota bacterium]|nr:MAG: outer membrane protein assembly factor BamA [Gemmatimonadota bacterium]
MSLQNNNVRTVIFRYIRSKVRTVIGPCFLFVLLNSAILWGWQDEPMQPSQLKIGAIQFQGNSHFSSRVLKGKMRTKESSVLRLRASSRFDESILQQDIGFLEAFYHKHGFLECTISKEVNSIHQGKAFITIIVQEATQTMVSKVAISGLQSLSPLSVIQRLANDIGLTEDTPLDISKLTGAETIIRNELANNGYPFATVTSRFTREGDQAEVHFHVTQGPLVHIGTISYRGYRQSQIFIIRRELLFHRGDRFDRDKLIESQLRIYSTGLYTYVNIEPIITVDSSVVDILVTVAEKEKRWFGIRTGVGQQEELDLTLDGYGVWGHRNMFGTGRRVSLSAGGSANVRTKSLLSNEYKMSYTEPWVLNTRTPLTVDIYFRRFTWELYTLEEFGGDVSVSHEFPQKLKTRVAFVYKRADVFDVPKELEPDILGQAGVDIVRKISFMAERDTRDHPLYPSRGIHSQVVSEFTGGFLGGNKDFYKMVAAWSGFQKWLPKTVIAGRMKWGMVKEFGKSTYVPIYDRFFAGGANTLRGYVERQLGPLEDGKPIGGSLLFLTNIELRRQLFWRFGMTAFFDSGYLWRSLVDFQWRDVRASLGAGLQFFTPVGPLRLEYGYKLRKEEELKRGVFHLSLLYAF